MAVPANTSDLTYERWIKSELPGISLPSGGTHAQFRDPVEAWQVDDTWYTAVGAQVCLAPTLLQSRAFQPLFGVSCRVSAFAAVSQPGAGAPGLCQLSRARTAVSSLAGWQHPAHAVRHLPVLRPDRDAPGVQVDCIGSAQLYSSPDLMTWTPAGTLASQVRACPWPKSPVPCTLSPGP